jgi:hypothetical protein
VEEMGQISRLGCFDPEMPEPYRRFLDRIELPFVLAHGRTQAGAMSGTIQAWVLSVPDGDDDVVEMLLDHVHRQVYPDKPRRPRPLFSPAMQLLRSDWSACRSMMRQYRVFELPVEVMVSNCPAAEYSAHVMVEVPGVIGLQRIRVRSLIVVQREIAYAIRMSAPAASPFDFEPFVRTIRVL